MKTPYKLFLKRILCSCGLYPTARLLLAHSMNVHPSGFVRHFVDRNSGSYKTMMSFFRQLISKGDLVFDIGANCEGLTEVFLDLGAKVIACEPQPDCFRELTTRHAHRRGLTALNCALGATQGTNKFYVRRDRGVSGFMRDWATEHEVERVLEVQILTLDGLIEEYGLPKYCKLDVEGYEYEVLKGLTRAIPMLSLEYHATRSDLEKSIECLNYLSKFGGLSINASPREDFRFLFGQWVSKDYFVELLTKQGSDLSSLPYADMFVRIQH